ncbi:MAG: oligosaccharide flippase family protein [Gemmataceae bacterium]|nr:oligosaccharide flippase family protein [Gemmataceae bacterium]
MTQAMIEQTLNPDRSRAEGWQSNHNTPAAGQRIVRNSAFNLTAQALYATFHLVVVFALAHALEKDVFGQYYMFFALILTVQLILEVGVSTVLTCRIAQAPERWRETAAEAAGIFGVIAVASAAVFLALGGAWAWWHGNAALLPCFVAAGVACAAIQVQRYCTGILHAFELFGLENTAKILQGMLYALLVILAVTAGLMDLASVLAMLAASQVLAAVFLLVRLQRSWGCLTWRLSVHRLKDWLAEAVPLGMGDVVRGLTWQIDTLLLGILQPAAVVGIYSVAYRPLGPLNWLPRAVLIAAFPSFARMAESDRAGLDRASATSLRLLWIISLPIAVSINACAEPIVTLLAGDQYLEAVAPMRILIWIAALSYVSFQFRFLFAALGRQRIYIVLVVGVLAVEGVLQWFLIQRWSYFGACAGTMIGEVLFVVLGLAICRRLGVGRIDVKAMLGAAVAAVIMAGLLWLARGFSDLLLFIAAALSSGIYFLFCVWLGALRPEEVQSFWRILTDSWRPALAGRMSTPISPRDIMTATHVKQRYQDEEVVKRYDLIRFHGPIGRTIDALEKRAIRKVLRTALAELPAPAVLDVPCGTGRITELLLEQGLAVTGGDISLAMIEAAQAKLGDRVRFKHLDLERLDLPDQSFDLITCIRLFNHIGAAEQERILQELARVSRRFVVLNLSFSSSLYRYTPYLKCALGMPMPRALPPWSELEQRMSTAGFAIANVAYELRYLSEVVVLLLRRK